MRAKTLHTRQLTSKIIFQTFSKSKYTLTCQWKPAGKVNCTLEDYNTVNYAYIGTEVCNSETSAWSELDWTDIDIGCKFSAVKALPPTCTSTYTLTTTETSKVQLILAVWDNVSESSCPDTSLMITQSFTFWNTKRQGVSWHYKSIRSCAWLRKLSYKKRKELQWQQTTVTKHSLDWS